MIEKYATSHNLVVVKELCGYGIATDMHKEHDIPNYVTTNVDLLDDSWTVVTADLKPFTHFKHIVLATKF